MVLAPSSILNIFLMQYFIIVFKIITTVHSILYPASMIVTRLVFVRLLNYVFLKKIQNTKIQYNT